MFKNVLLLLFMTLNLYSAGFNMQKFIWPNGVSFLQFLENLDIPGRLYYSLSETDKELATEIVAGTECEMLVGNNGVIDQILIPITEELQIHIYKDSKKDYALTFTPTVYTEEIYQLGISIESSPYLDINKATGNSALANAFSVVFSKVVNFQRLQKEDGLALIYKQKERLGQPYGQTEIISGMIEEKGESKYMYQYEGKYYNEKGKLTENFLFKRPIPGAKISSKFTLKRFHPVHKIYRAHLGTDYSAKSGTPIKAVADGTVSFVGTKGGYGRTVEIKHVNGYRSLYAHTSKFAKNLKNGQNIKQGDVIAYVGSTGTSTGAHLHLGLYKNNKAIDFEKAVGKEKETQSIKEKKEFEKVVRDQNEKLQMAMGGFHNPDKFTPFDSFINF
ncbi:MAG: M23 family metallopeptidase [Campylobacter sp.]|nr:M23 family metallopeptidase [Campylobacter sp.]